MNEQLNSLEDAVQDLNKVLKEMQATVVRYTSKISTSIIRQNQSTNDYSNSQCIWQRSSPTNTTFNVLFLSKIFVYSSFHSIGSSIV